MNGQLRALGIGRDAEDERTLFVIFNRAPDDDEMRNVHDLLRQHMAAAEPPRPFAPVEAYDEQARSRFRDLAAEAAMKCGEPAFKAYLEAEHGLERPLTDERCAQKLRSLCGVISRAELNQPGRAADAWVELRRAFEAWRKRGRS